MFSNELMEKIGFYLNIPPEKFLECLKCKKLETIKFLCKNIKIWDIHYFYFFSKSVSVSSLEIIKFLYYKYNFVVTKSVLRIGITRNDRDIIKFLCTVSEGKLIPKDYLKF